MAQYAQDLKKSRRSAYINLAFSVFITIAAIVYMFVMNTYLPEVTDQAPWIVYIPTLALLSVSIWITIKPQPLDW